MTVFELSGAANIEKYFLRKVRTGSVTPIYEKYVLKLLGIVALKASKQ